MPEPVLVLAPIRGITDAAYRNAIAELFGGFDRAVAPFIKLKQGHPLRAVELSEVAPANNQHLPTVAQVHTNDAARFVEALREFADLGLEAVNLNLGCPYPMVTKRGRGAGLLPHPERIERLLEAGCALGRMRLSVKLRLGLKDPDEFRAVFAVLNRYPLSEVALHARIATQMYRGAVDLERAAEACALSVHPFVYNGEITTPASYAAVRAHLPQAAGFMLGRGALANPLLPQLLRGRPLPAVAVRRERLQALHERLATAALAVQRGRGFLLKMREHWTYLAFAFRDPVAIRKCLYPVREEGAYQEAVDGVLRQPLAEFSVG